MTVPEQQPIDPTLSVLAQLGLDDDRIAQLGQIMAALQPQQPDLREIEKLEAEIERLKELNRILVAHSDFLAAAVGACPDCWGENPSCPVCGGQGGPGAFMPDRVSFDEFVRPVLSRLKKRLARQRRRQTTASDAAATSSNPRGGSDATA